jgi:hypothetical protein
MSATTIRPRPRPRPRTRHCRYCRSAWGGERPAGDGGLYGAAFPFTFAGACTAPPACRPGTSSRYSNRKVGRAVPVTPLRGVTGEPHTGHGTANPAQYATYPPLRELPQSGADIPVCARPRGQAGMSATHYHAPSLRLAETASPHLRLRAFARASPALDDRRRHPTTINHNRHRLASGRQAPSSMTISRPFRASLFSPRYPGRCPGLVYRAPSGLASTLSRDKSFVGNFIESERTHESHDTKQKVKFAASSREFARKWI